MTQSAVDAAALGGRSLAPLAALTDDTAFHLGDLTDKAIRSSVGPFHVLPDYHIEYPAPVIEALGLLYQEYNAAFVSLVAANREWATDYAPCFFGPGNTPMNCAVQIDMLGLTPEFLRDAAAMSAEAVREVLRGSIFEIENSLAMYQLLERIFQREEEQTYFKARMRSVLVKLRKRFNRPIALLAVTEQKYNAMLESEFGVMPGEPITDAEVLELSGFDRFFGPAEFRAELDRNGGSCPYLLYVRSSDPLTKLKKPETAVAHPLLADPTLRRVIKANALTLNIDAPDQPSECRINDTKGYLRPMDMAYEIGDEGDLFSAPFRAHLAAGKPWEGFLGNRLSPGLTGYLQSRGIDRRLVETGAVALRAKPLKGTYGCYGHVTGRLSDTAVFRAELRRNLRQRGRYVVQPELETPRVTNADSGLTYTYIDRNFFGCTGGRPVFLGGFRSMLPVGSHEAEKKRIHGNGDTVWAEIVATP